MFTKFNAIQTIAETSPKLVEKYDEIVKEGMENKEDFNKLFEHRKVLLKEIQDYINNEEFDCFHHDFDNIEKVIELYDELTEGISDFRHREFDEVFKMIVTPFEYLAVKARKRTRAIEEKPIDRWDKLGEFNVTSGILRFTDPCYKKDTWCAGTESGATNGKWIGHVRYAIDWGLRSFYVGAVHSDYEVKLPMSRDDMDEWELSEIHVGVDSGQAGIFDEDAFIGRPDDNEAWYGTCCDATLGEKRAGIVKEGVVAGTGHGDGGYNAYVKKQDGKIIAAIIDFMGDLGIEEEQD